MSGRFPHNPGETHDRGRGRGGYRGRGRGRGNYGNRGGRNIEGGEQGAYGGARDNDYRGERGGRGRGNGKGPRKPREHPMSFTALHECLNKEPNEIILGLNNPGSGFIKFLEQGRVRPDFMKLALNVITKCLDRTIADTFVLELLHQIEKSTFTTGPLVLYFTEMLTETSQAKHQDFKEAIEDSLLLMTELLHKLPSSVSKVNVPLSVLKTTLEQLQITTNIVDVNLLEKHEDVMQMLYKSLRKNNTHEEPRKRTELLYENEAPPDDFRDISIFPTQNDIYLNERPFLRVNKARGAYQDIDHYLDVQFRLLREDFVKPLRDGIEEYKHQRTSLKQKKLQDIRMYQRVFIRSPLCQADGIYHKIQFDVSKMRNIKWRISKRLIFGSLLCLSRDNFQTFLFATVSNRQEKELSDGIIDVRFEEKHDEIAKINPDVEFQMVETTAYFEAYRHVLKALQRIRANELPFQRYIVECKTELKPPRYLLEGYGKTFDLRPLITKEVVEVTKKASARQRPRHRGSLGDLLMDISDSDDEDPVDQVLERELTRVASSQAKSVNMLRTNTWPDAEQMRLDQTQYEAVKMALTKEFVVIQGPPGTGKTYIGLKIVQALLHNRDVWTKNRMGNIEQSPILVVCYTNHALDQFLEGIYKFWKTNIVRIGGRSKSELMEKFLLKNLKQVMKNDRKIPIEVHRGKFQLMDQLKDIQMQLDKTVSLIEASHKGLVKEDVLEEFMNEDHYNQLTDGPPTFNDPFQMQFQTGKRVQVMDWLGVGDNYYELPTDNLTGAMGAMQVAGPDDDDDDDDEDEYVTVDDEADAIAAERTLDEDDLDQNRRRQQELQRIQNEQEAAGTLALDINNMQDAGQYELAGGWMTQTNRKSRKKTLKRGLQGTDAMTDDEANDCYILWDLPLKERWRLYRNWINKYRNSLKSKIQDYEREYERQARQMVDLRREEDFAVLKQAVVIGMTTTGAAKYQSLIQRVKPKIVVVEEAAEVLESHIVTTLSEGCEHLILIGDHKQLRPNPTVYDLARKYNLEISFFERMINNRIPYECLELQHRMRPEIATLVSDIYPELRDHKSVHHYERVKGVAKNMFFVDHTVHETSDIEIRSKSNPHEAEYIVKLCKYLIQQGYKREEITILTLYTGQMFTIKKLMPKEYFQGVRVCAVDNFQGEENEIVLLSLVRSNEENSIGFLKIENRVCVALSRAKRGFYAIGNMTLLAKNSDLWRKIYGRLRHTGNVGEALELYCQNHPKDNHILVKTAADFDKAPEGGCTKKCDARLDCGHTCPQFCHNIDAHHEDFQCRKPCAKKCPEGHTCSKMCYQNCGTCQTRVIKTIPACGHTQNVPCHMDPATFNCTMPCSKKLSCGHTCKEQCWGPCSRLCKEKSGIYLECGHYCKVECYKMDKSSEIVCTQPCSDLLLCGHKCQGTCGSCQREKCEWQCQHHQCSQPCSEPCDRPRCDRPCMKKFTCFECKNRYTCIGLCGEKCPPKCPNCDKAEIREVFFGTEEDQNAKFVQLEDCGHILEVEGLDAWVDKYSDDSGTVDIQYKTCPKCKTPIRKNLRYGDTIKKMDKYIAAVKEKIIGSRDEVKILKQNVEREIKDFSLTDSVISNDLQTRVNIPTDYITINLLNAVKMQLDFTRQFTKLADDVQHQKHKSIGASTGDVVDFRARCGQIKTKIETTIRWVLKNRQRFTEQEALECQKELTRLKLQSKAYVIDYKASKVKDKLKPEYIDCIEQSIDELEKGVPLKDDTEARITKNLKILEKKLAPTNGLGISDGERVEILKAMGLTKGHWYKCANGHIYAIGDCGGATVEATCPECKSTIGGSGHALRSDNKSNNIME
ncbi:unnamed protein product [Owenia fusiformis]|uniref:RZ-type domain-containing protein n=1 Tax=Owenia fusiformis TaxID=6347 RepID=A0A8S4NK58_OWEFU|nr:unnamed protein product [Owenia fusiformis]